MNRRYFPSILIAGLFLMLGLLMYRAAVRHLFVNLVVVSNIAESGEGEFTMPRVDVAAFALCVPQGKQLAAGTEIRVRVVQTDIGEISHSFTIEQALRSNWADKEGQTAYVLTREAGGALDGLEKVPSGTRCRVYIFSEPALPEGANLRLYYVPK